MVWAILNLASKHTLEFVYTMEIIMMGNATEEAQAIVAKLSDGSRPQTTASDHKRSTATVSFPRESKIQTYHYLEKINIDRLQTRPTGRSMLTHQRILRSLTSVPTMPIHSTTSLPQNFITLILCS